MFVEFVDQVPANLLGVYSVSIPLFTRRLIFHGIRELTAALKESVFNEDYHYFTPQTNVQNELL